MIMGGGHVHAIDTSILGFVEGASKVLHPFMLDGGALLLDAPWSRTILGGLLGGI
jgi:hypothetical protein